MSIEITFKIFHVLNLLYIQADSHNEKKKGNNKDKTKIQ